jgi:hypothetical protein
MRWHDRCKLIHIKVFAGERFFVRLPIPKEGKGAVILFECGAFCI